MQSPSTADGNGIVSLRELIDFVAHVADCYPSLTADFPQDLMKTITLHHAELEMELRDKIVGSLVLLRNKDVIDSSAWVFCRILYELALTTMKSLEHAIPNPGLYSK